MDAASANDRDATTDTCGWSDEHLADASLDRRRDGDVSRLLEVRVVEVAVGRDTVEIEQFAAELLADLSARATLTRRPIDRATMIGSSQYASFVPR